MQEKQDLNYESVELELVEGPYPPDFDPKLHRKNLKIKKDSIEEDKK